MNILDQNVTVLKGIGEYRAKILKKLYIETLSDLMNYFPRGYIDMSAKTDINNLLDGQTAVILGEVSTDVSAKKTGSKITLYKFKVADSTGILTVILFNQRYTAEKIKKGDILLFYGKVSVIGDFIEMKSPQIEFENIEGLSPKYSLSEGISQKMLQNTVKHVLSLTAPQIKETLTPEIRSKFGLIGLAEAYKGIHFPADYDMLENARKRLIFEELLLFSLGVYKMKSQSQKLDGIQMLSAVDMTEFYNCLPYTLTKAQNKVIAESIEDLKNIRPMSRIIQGDVGSGKTVVAAALMYYTKQNGFQSCLMVPTEILAIQHYNDLLQLFDKLSVSCALLTGSTKAADRKEIFKGLIEGTIDILIGTHALIEDNVEFKNLALAITDEQHRFGVRQRAALIKKGKDNSSAHVLVMSATPIPRTLALIVYSDLDLSVIDELPPGRQKISTFLLDSTYNTRMYEYVCRQVKMGGQAYVICPLVEEGDNESLRAVSAYAEELKKKYLADVEVEFLHGKMKSAAKEKTLNDFVKNEIQVLVSTTVIEVGVNVPNATIMIIENAERFGLSQLHQLRGRVGRGNKKSYCFLISDTENEQTLERLNAFCSTNDGFEISQKDLEIRGPGDFFGSRQHGLPEFKIANLARDMSILKDAQEAAKLIISDPLWYKSEENLSLKEAITRFFKTVESNIAFN